MPGPPTPASPEEAARQAHTAERWRLLYGRGYDDLWMRVVKAVGVQRAKAWRPLNQSSNASKLVWSRLAGLYHDEPALNGPAEEVAEEVAESGFWSRMQRNQRDTLCLRELIVLCDRDEDGRPTSSIIWPHRAQVVAKPRRPGELVAVSWWEPDPDSPDDKWVQYHIDPRSERYSANNERGDDVTARVIKLPPGSDPYPWRYKGAPIQPAVMYHAAHTGQTWDPFEGIEIHEGSFSLALQYTHFDHVVRHAAWSQRWILNARARGAEAGPDGTTAQVVADAATVLDLAQDDGDIGGNAQVGQWTNPTDPEKLIAAIRNNEKRLMEQALGGVEISRQTSDIRSGYSLAVGREAQILAQEEFAPVFKVADRRCLQIWSMLLSERDGVDYPVSWPTRTGGTRLTISGSTRPEYDVEYSIPGGVPSEPSKQEGTP